MNLPLTDGELGVLFHALTAYEKKWIEDKKWYDAKEYEDHLGDIRTLLVRVRNEIRKAR